MGNGFTIKNFVFETYFVNTDEDINDRDSYRMSLFGNTRGAVIENVNFSGVTFVIDAGKRTIQAVIVSPISIKAEDSVFRNITFEGSYTIRVLPGDMTEESESFVMTPA